MGDNGSPQDGTKESQKKSKEVNMERALKICRALPLNIEPDIDQNMQMRKLSENEENSDMIKVTIPGAKSVWKPD